MRWLNRKSFKAVAVGGAVVFALIQLVPVELVNNNPSTRGPLEAPPQVRAALQTACFDCHSNETRWPWYSRIAPSSWLTAHDVEDGRKAINLSEWGDRLEEDRQFDRESMWEQIELGDMPPKKYLLLHPEAVLSEEQKRAVEAWANADAALGDHDASELGDDANGAADGDATDPPSAEDTAGGAGGAGTADDSADTKADGDASAAAPSAGEDTASGNKPGAAADGPSAKPSKPPPAAKPVAPTKPSPATPSPPAPAPAKPSPPPPAVYDGPNPCRATSFGFSNVRSACEKGGSSKAKDLMKFLVKKGKDNGTSFKCSSCHQNQKTFEPKPNAKADFRKLLDATK